jgi:subtilisin family serine protease
MTAAKGMVSVTSAGNSGNDSWRYIGAPADATDILSVGAVDQSGKLAAFSSRGPTYDHRIKPEVSAMGALTAVQASDSTARLGYGTSYSSPMIAGAAAALWQAFPTLTSKELMRRIIESGDRYEAPDASYGYGIPSFRAAYWAITSTGDHTLPGLLKAWPNPFTDRLFIEAPGDPDGVFNMQLCDIQGRTVFAAEITTPGSIDLPGHIRPGIYILQLSNGSQAFRTRIIRK